MSIIMAYVWNCQLWTFIIRHNCSRKKWGSESVKTNERVYDFGILIVKTVDSEGWSSEEHKL